MRVLISSKHRYPAFGEVGTGHHPTSLPSGSGHHLNDLLVKGLTELGHEVFYLLRNGAEKPLPQGATLLSEPILDVDIFHYGGENRDLLAYMDSHHVPWVMTCHLNWIAVGRKVDLPLEHFILVSSNTAAAFGSDRYVLNGIDPADYLFSESKEDYFLFMSNLDKALDKGMDVALSLSMKMGLKLVLAGGSVSYSVINEVAEMCRRAGARFVGDVRGRAKAELIAGAKALLFPSKLTECLPLLIAEALMSGTPVISANTGGCAEIVSPEVGFLCESVQDYVHAIKQVDTISPAACRDKAMSKFHYLRMTADYVKEYEQEIAKHSLRPVRA